MTFWHWWTANTKALLTAPSASRSYTNSRVIHFPQGNKNTFFLFSVQGREESSEGDRSCYRYDQLKLILSPTSELPDQGSKCSVIDAERGTTPGNQAVLQHFTEPGSWGTCSWNPLEGVGLIFGGSVGFGMFAFALFCCFDFVLF